MANTDQLFKRAEESFAKRNYDYSRDLFQQILLLDPNHGEARKALRATILTKYKEGGAPGRIKLALLWGKTKAHLATAKNNAQKRVDICAKYVMDDPNNSGVRTSLAQALFELGHKGGAAIEAEMALESDPKNVTAAKILVEGYKSMGKVSEAQDILTKIQRHAPDDRDLERLQRDLAAIATTQKGFTDAADTDDGYRSVMKDKGKAGQLERAQHMIKSVDDAKAYISDLSVKFEAEPDYKIARKIGDTLLDFLKDTKTAREWFVKAADLNPQDTVLKDKIEDCTIRAYENQIKKAEKENDPRLAEYKKNQLKAMIQAYERRALDRPTDMEVHFKLGEAFFKAGKNFLDKAIHEFQLAVKDPKKKIDSHFFLGLAFQRKKIFDMAETQYEKALVSGVMGNAKKLSITYHQAVCAAEGGNLAKAMELGKTIMADDISYRDISQRVEQWAAKA